MLSRNILEKVRLETGRAVRLPFKKFVERSAHRYLEAAGVFDFLVSGDPEERTPNYSDLAYLHRAIRKRKSRHVLEFGVGNSTITMLHALALNHKERPNKPHGELHTVDASQRWLDNTRQKVPQEVQEFIHLNCSTPRIAVHNCELCHFHDELPNIVPRSDLSRWAGDALGGR